jgi:hypothetical protein
MPARLSSDLKTRGKGNGPVLVHLPHGRPGRSKERVCERSIERRRQLKTGRDVTAVEGTAAFVKKVLQARRLRCVKVTGDPLWVAPESGRRRRPSQGEAGRDWRANRLDCVGREATYPRPRTGNSKPVKGKEAEKQGLGPTCVLSGQGAEDAICSGRVAPMPVHCPNRENGGCLAVTMLQDSEG